MAFQVEDGTGLADANSYASVEFADQYFSDRKVTDWIGTPEDKQAWLIQATDYIEGRFGARFVGAQQFPYQQALAFPRVDLPGTSKTMPANLLRATAEYALRAKLGPLAPDPKLDASGYALVATRKKVGPIETEFAAVGGTSGAPRLFKPYPAADMLLGKLLRSSRRVIR